MLFRSPQNPKQQQKRDISSEGSGCINLQLYLLIMEDADGWGESNSLEEDVNNWIACAFEEYSEVMPMLKEIKDNVVKIEMLEKDYVIEVEGERNLPTSIQAN